MLTGAGVYVTPFGTGAQTVTVDRATVVGDEFFAFGLTQATSGGVPVWGAPNPPFTHGLDVNTLKVASHDALFGTFCWMAHGAPGAQAAGKVYTFTHDAAISMRSILLLFRCAQQILSDAAPNLTTGSAAFPVVSPATLAVTLALANPGFDLWLMNNKGQAGFLPATPTGLPGGMTPIALLNSQTDNMDIIIALALASRNVAFAGTLSDAWAGNAVDGWTAIVSTAQLGATNTPSTLTFPGAIPLAGRGGALNAGAIHGQHTRDNPAQFGFGPRTGKHWQRRKPFRYDTGRGLYL